jgi:N-acetylmuramoyl-L-alanine amidase
VAFQSIALRAALLLVAALGLAACAPAPLRTGLPVEWTPSPSFGERRPAYVILHHTTNDTAGRALATLTGPASEVSAHYLIGREGRIYQLVDERLRAWHAGTSSWGGNTDINSASIGIELDNNGAEPFAEAQITTLLALLADLRERYKIAAMNFLGHGDIAPRRKVDPSHLFPWRRLAAAGFGLWCEAPAATTTAAGDSAVLLQAFGYDVSDLPAAISAFRRHFSGDGAPHLGAATGDLGDAERATLQCLVARKREQGG